MTPSTSRGLRPLNISPPGREKIFIPERALCSLFLWMSLVMIMLVFVQFGCYSFDLWCIRTFRFETRSEIHTRVYWGRSLRNTPPRKLSAVCDKQTADERLSLAWLPIQRLRLVWLLSIARIAGGGDNPSRDSTSLRYSKTLRLRNEA